MNFIIIFTILIASSNTHAGNWKDLLKKVTNKQPAPVAQPAVPAPVAQPAVPAPVAQPAVPAPTQSAPIATVIPKEESKKQVSIYPCTAKEDLSKGFKITCN